MTRGRHLKRLKSASVVERRKAAQALAESKAACELAEIEPGLRDADEQVRASCVEALAHTPDPGCPAALGLAFGDSSARVQQAARRAIKQHWSPDFAAQVAILLRHPTLPVRARAAALLAEMNWKPSTSEDEIRFSLGRGSVFVVVRFGEQALDALEDELKSRLPTARQRTVIEALGRIGGTRASSLLRQQLASGETARVLAAVDALSEVDAKVAMPCLLGLLRTNDTWQRAAAITELAAISPDDALPHLVPLLQDAAWNIRLAAVAGLGKSGRPETVAHLAPLLLEDRDADVREAAAGALGELGAPSAIEPLVEALKDQTSGVRKAAKLALEKIDPAWMDSSQARVAIDKLASFLDNKNPDVRYAVADLLSSFGVTPPQTQYYVPELTYFYEIQQSLGVSQDRPDPGSVEKRRKFAVSLMTRTLGDERRELRLAAALALGRLGNPRALPALQSALRDKEPAVRCAAEQSILQMQAVMKETNFFYKKPHGAAERPDLEAEEIILCAGSGEVLFTWQCKSVVRRVTMLQHAQQFTAFLEQNSPAGQFQRLDMCSAAEHANCLLSQEQLLFVRCSLPPAEGGACCRLFSSCPRGALELESGGAPLEKVMAFDAPGLQAICVSSADQISSARCGSFVSPEQVQQVATRLRAEAERLVQEQLGCHCFCWSFTNTRLTVALHPAGETLVAFTAPTEPDVTQPLLSLFLNSAETESGAAACGQAGSCA